MIQIKATVAALAIAASAVAGATGHILLTRVNVECSTQANRDDPELRDFMRPAPPAITGNPRY